MPKSNGTNIIINNNNSRLRDTDLSIGENLDSDGIKTSENWEGSPNSRVEAIQMSPCDHMKRKKKSRAWQVEGITTIIENQASGRIPTEMDTAEARKWEICKEISCIFSYKQLERNNGARGRQLYNCVCTSTYTFVLKEVTMNLNLR